MQTTFEKNGFKKRLTSMLKVDFRRMFTTPLYYIMVGISLVIPVLILVMTSMMDGMVSVDPQTGAETVMEGFDNVWQIFGSLSSASAGGASMAGGMSLTAMCNINMLYFGVAVFVCLFVADDFRSGYAKNLFAVRAKKTEYILSKTVVGFVGAASMLIAFFVGAMIGGGVAGLPFAMEGFTVGNFVACLLSKILLSSIFVALPLLAAVIAKQKGWLSILLSLGFGMMFFAVIPMVTPLDATALHVVLCLVGGAGLCVGIGAISTLVLKKTSLV